MTQRQEVFATLGIWQSTGMHVIRNMNLQNKQVMQSMERLSSGMRINRAANDPAGTAISEKMRAQIRGLSMAGRNIQDGISLFQTSEGALNETHSILQRMRELSVQSSNGTLTNSNRENLSLEFEELKNEITRISNDTGFNSLPLLDGSRSPLKIQAGANGRQSIEFYIDNMSATSTRLKNVSIMDSTKANILLQAGQYVLSMHMQQAQSVLQLLKQ